jgi:MFS family permease
MRIRKKQVVDAALLTAGITILLLTFVIPLFSYWVRVILSFFAVLIIGFSFVGIVVPSQTFLQESTPENLRGRVFGNFWFLVTIASVVPVIFSGSIVEILGIRVLLLILSLFSITLFFISRRFGDSFLGG